MEEVWITERVIEYEPGYILGVYSTYEKAEEARDKAIEERDGFSWEYEITRWKVDDNYNGDKTQ